MWKIVLLAICVRWAPSGLAADCPAVCSCAQIEGRAAAHCQNGRLSAVPYGIPANTMSLVFTKNNLDDELADFGYFAKRKLNSLIKLDLSHSNVASIGPGTFKNLSILEELDLSWNSLEEIPDGGFQDLSRLKSLNLAKNHLPEISAKMLEGLPLLEEVDFSSNLIDFIFKEGFQNLINIKRIFLQGNRLIRLTSDVFYRLPHLRLVNLVDNPWICDCMMREFVEWQSGQYLTASPSCTEPARYRGKTWDQLTPEEFACAPEFLRSEMTLEKTVQTATPGSSVRFECPLVADPEPDVVWDFRPTNASGRRILHPSENLSFLRTVNPLKANSWTFSLVIKEVFPKETGLYTCIASNKANSDHEVFHLRVEEPEESNSATVESAGIRKIVTDLEATGDLWVIIVVVAVAVLLVFILFFVICWFRKDLPGRRRNAYASVNGYDYRVIEGGFLERTSPEKAMKRYYCSSTSAVYELPPPHSEQHKLTAAFVEDGTSLAQDDSGYLDAVSAQHSPKANIVHKHRCLHVPLPQTPSTPLPADKLTVHDLPNGKTPLAQSEKGENTRMPLRETAL